MGGFHGHITLSDVTANIHHDENKYGEVVAFTSEDCSVMADGFIYNLNDLKKSYGANSSDQVLKRIYERNSSDFPHDLKGEFSSVVISKEWVEIGTNHSCSRRVFYAEFQGKLFVHWNLKLLQRELHALGFTSHPNPIALRSLISIGGVFGNNTVIQDIHILRAGEKIRIDSSGWRLVRYYLPNTVPTPLSKSDFLGELHNEFLNTVRQQYDHPGTMGFQLLSGGLDSRLNLSLVAENGIRQQAVLCFGQTGYRDHWISEQIASAHQLKHDFVPLENGDYLTAIDENILAVDGLCFYASSAHFNYALDVSKYLSPIIHTGQVGRTIFTEHAFNKSASISSYRQLLSSTRFADAIDSEVKAEMNLYDDIDVFYLNNRLYRVISSGNFVAQKAGFIVSPFADPDVQNLAYSMPIEWKQNGQIQWEYMWKYHTSIMKFAQEEYGRTVRSEPERFIGRVENKLRNIYYKKINKQPQKLSMNPLEYWWDCNAHLREALTRYFTENRDRLDFDPELKTQCSALFNSQSVLEKTLALSVVGVLKNYFD